MNTLEIPKNVHDYFRNGPRKIIKVVPDDNYSLLIYFDNTEQRIYDMTESLYGVFEVLKDKAKFNQVFIDESGNIAWDIDSNIDSSIHWNNRIDICKDSAYLDSHPLSQV